MSSTNLLELHFRELVLIFYLIILHCWFLEQETPFIYFREGSVTGSMLSLNTSVVSLLEVKTRMLWMARIGIKVQTNACALLPQWKWLLRNILQKTFYSLIFCHFLKFEMSGIQIKRDEIEIRKARMCTSLCG